MTSPLSPSDLQRVLASLSPERSDPFPHRADLSADLLLMGRVEVTGQIKTLEHDRQAIDAELLEVFSDPELRHGLRAPGGWVLRSRSRNTWDYPPETRDAIKDPQRLAQRDGRAQPLVSSYLCLTHEDACCRESSIRR
jgi:hypothetical protein